MRLYREVAGVDWVQFTSPRSVDEIRQARAVVDGPFSVMESHLPAPLDHSELLDLGIALQWAPGVTHLAAQTAVYEMVQHLHAARAGARCANSASATPTIRTSLGNCQDPARRYSSSASWRPATSALAELKASHQFGRGCHP